MPVRQYAPCNGNNRLREINIDTSTEHIALSGDAVSAIDAANQLGDILAMPDHIEDALWRAESAMIAPKPAKALVVCGMGGSAIGADLAVALIGARLRCPIHIVRGYDLPSWVDADCAVLCSSYSGNTEETLSCWQQAGEIGATRYVASAGGSLSQQAHDSGVAVIGLPGVLQPRAAVAYMVTAVVEIAVVTGAADASLRDELRAAITPLRALASQWLPDAPDDALPKRLARSALGSEVVLYGGGPTTPVAVRWKCQINENAKVPAWSAELPEANHNDINGWDGAASVGKHSVWFLRDSGQHERVQRRIDFTADVVTKAGVTTEILDAPGETATQRLFGSVLCGDLTSLYLAVLIGVDPSPVPIIEGLKDWLGRP
ncbi:MAG: bifunctional phosphoglucose/phosphomannose isomerase [Thermoleophilaceae bacterium]|nr:bifunctional phosphoglucose/phosphomannose isomerase [Thermoleophilaceae bacterium]